MEGFLPHEMQRFNDWFPVRLTAVTNSSGTFLYDGNEQISNSTASYINSNPGRTFTNTQNLLVEVNNLQLNTVANTVVLARLRGVKASDGVHVYEFISGTPSSGSAATFSGVYALAVTDQSLADFTHVPVIFDSERFDTDGYHSNTVNNTRLTAPTTGYYHVGGSVGFASNTAGHRQMFIYKNGTEGLAVTTDDAHGTGENPVLFCSGIGQFSAGDYAVMTAFQSTGGSLNTVNSNCLFWMFKIA